MSAVRRNQSFDPARRWLLGWPLLWGLVCQAEFDHDITGPSRRQVLRVRHALSGGLFDLQSWIQGRGL